MNTTPKPFSTSQTNSRACASCGLASDCCSCRQSTSDQPRPTYRERREARADRLHGWADKRQSDATATIEHIDNTYRGDYAFNTQPGHIPERARVIARQERAFESLRKAESMTSRANGIESQLAGSIYSDDPDALEARIADLEADRARIKAYNASCKAGAPNPDLLTDKQRADLAGVTRHSPYSLGKQGQFPGYALTNLSGNINRNKKRLAALRNTNKEDVVADFGNRKLVRFDCRCGLTVELCLRPDSPRLCLDCRADDDRDANGWNPANSLS